MEHLERVAVLETQMKDVKHDLYGNGQKGFIEETRDYISMQKGMWAAVIGIGSLLLVLQGLSTVHVYLGK